MRCTARRGGRPLCLRLARRTDDLHTRVWMLVIHQTWRPGASVVLDAGCLTDAIQKASGLITARAGAMRRPQ